MISVGQTIGNYTITAKLGEGGMVVYLAEHPVIGRKVALKAIHPELSKNQEVVSRFITEAKAVNQIGNEHIVDIHDFGTSPDGEFYFIMEFLQGESLADKLRRERLLALERCLQIGAQVADALHASHDHHIIHRDLKPENIFLIRRGSSSDFVKVLDFGLAKLTGVDEKVTHKTRTGSVMGTPYYMAPEQCEGKASIDQRADIYSLGVIVFEMMTGRVPFGGDGYGEIIVKHITLPPPVPRSLNPQISPAQEAILMRALAKHREDRFQSMAEMRVAMLDPERYLASDPPIPRTTPLPSAVASPVDEAVSGRVVFGGAARRSDPDHPGPLPSTFGGEVIDEDFIPTRSRRGLVIGAIVAAATAAAGAFVLYGRAASAPGPEAPRPPEQAPAAAPSTPAETAIKFDSRPPGAQVTRRDSGEELGTTPFRRTLPHGSSAVEFVFRRPGFTDTVLSLVPAMPSATLEAILPPEAPPAAAPEEPNQAAKPVAAPPVAARPAAAPPRPRPPRPKKPARPIDEDGVLDPSFQ